LVIHRRRGKCPFKGGLLSSPGKEKTSTEDKQKKKQLIENQHQIKGKKRGKWATARSGKTILGRPTTAKEKRGKKKKQAQPKP